jgi:hypothetical protein
MRARLLRATRFVLRQDFAVAAADEIDYYEDISR